MRPKGFLQFEIIMNVLVISLFEYLCYGSTTIINISFFQCVDEQFWRLKSVPALKGWMTWCFAIYSDTVCKHQKYIRKSVYFKWNIYILKIFQSDIVPANIEIEIMKDIDVWKWFPIYINFLNMKFKLVPMTLILSIQMVNYVFSAQKVNPGIDD